MISPMVEAFGPKDGDRAAVEGEGHRRAHRVRGHEGAGGIP